MARKGLVWVAESWAGTLFFFPGVPDHPPQGGFGECYNAWAQVFCPLQPL